MWIEWQAGENIFIYIYIYIIRHKIHFIIVSRINFFHSIVFVFLPIYIIHNVMFSINIIFKILLNVLSVMGFLVMHDPYKSKKGIFGIFCDTEVDIYRNSFWSELFSVNVNFDSAKECWKVLSHYYILTRCNERYISLKLARSRLYGLFYFYNV